MPVISVYRSRVRSGGCGIRSKVDSQFSFLAPGHSPLAPTDYIAAGATRLAPIHRKIHDRPPPPRRTPSSLEHNGKQPAEEAKPSLCRTSEILRRRRTSSRFSSLDDGEQLLDLRIQPGKLHVQNRFSRM